MFFGGSAGARAGSSGASDGCSACGGQGQSQYKFRKSSEKQLIHKREKTGKPSVLLFRIGALALIFNCRVCIEPSDLSNRALLLFQFSTRPLEEGSHHFVFLTLRPFAHFTRPSKNGIPPLRLARAWAARAHGVSALANCIMEAAGGVKAGKRHAKEQAP